MMKTLIATTLIATSAQGALCTFENLPAPTNADSFTNSTGFMHDSIGSYEGFNFTSSNMYSNYQWSYYDLLGGSGWGGYDEGIVGDRAIYTPWSSNSSYNYRINRGGELWRLNSLEVTAVWTSMTVVIEGYRYGEGVFTYTAQLNQADRTKLIITNAYPGALNNITEIKVYGVAPYSSHLVIDNINYNIVPAPSALALIGIAGIIGIRKRR